MKDMTTMLYSLDSILDFNFRLGSMYYNPNVPNDEAPFFCTIVQKNLEEFIETRLHSAEDAKEHIIERINILTEMISTYIEPLSNFVIQQDEIDDVVGEKPTTSSYYSTIYNIDQIDYEAMYLVAINSSNIPYVYKYYDDIQVIGKRVLLPNRQLISQNYLDNGEWTIINIKFFEDKKVKDTEADLNVPIAMMIDTNDEILVNKVKDAFQFKSLLNQGLDISIIHVSEIYFWSRDIYQMVIGNYPNKQVYPKLNPMHVNVDTLDVLNKRDMLIYTPYMDYMMVLEQMKMICESNVEYIFQTVYRLNEENSMIVSNLVNAAKRGVKVYVIIEERARGNEQNNYTYAKELINAGCKVIVNNSSKKIHSKLFCAVGKEKQYAFISTGNFNEKTARMYTDMHYLTSNPIVCRSIVHILNMIINKKFKDIALDEYMFNDYILSAPNFVKKELIMKIHEQAIRGKAGRIYIKCNNLNDPDIVHALTVAANKGCEIRLLVRTICILTESHKNVTIKTKLGQFLEHERIYIFGDNHEVYIGSADLMVRNLENRIETLVHVKDTNIADQIINIFHMNWYDVNNLIDSKLDKTHNYLEKKEGK